MAEFSDSEKSLLKSIPKNSPLRTSLSLLREASERIWAIDAPRIIRNYPDHGIPHSERIAGHAVSLLMANRGEQLSQDEMYLLLAGIYLHDIGMQCDIVHYPGIKEQAEKLGAQFKSPFTTRLSSDFSVQEQQAIRENHHYLSIAWIDYAQQTGETPLGQGARTIPTMLVDDLMDVCKHHTSLPISACSAKGQGGMGRKRLVAALLRFADELDIDANRVSIETVRAFRLDPSNAVYWWLHNHTQVSFPTTNSVKVQVWLRPDDAAQYRAIVQSAFIDKFRQKNDAVISALAENHIPIVIHTESRVEESHRQPLLPPEIGKALQAMSGQQGHSSTSGGHAPKQDSADVKIAAANDDLLAAARRLRGHLNAIEQLLADPDLRPTDCDTAINNLDAAQQAVQEIRELLSIPSIEPDLATAASDFQVLRHSLSQSIQQLKANLSQFRNSCPPTQPAAQQRRKALYDNSTQLLRWLAAFEGVLPSGPVSTSAPPPNLSTSAKNVASTAPVPTPASDPPPQKFESLQLAKLLSAVRALNTNQRRTQIAELLKDRLEIAGIDRNDSSDLFDIHGILTTCLQYKNGLGHLIKILREIDGASLPLRKVTEYLMACEISFELS